MLFFIVAAMAIEQSPEEMARWYRDMCKRLKREAEEPLLHFYCFVLLKNKQNLQRRATITKYQHPMWAKWHGNLLMLGHRTYFNLCHAVSKRSSRTSISDTPLLLFSWTNWNICHCRDTQPTFSNSPNLPSLLAFYSHLPTIVDFQQ